MSDDKSELALTLRSMGHLLAWERSLVEQVAGTISAHVPTCGHPPIDQPGGKRHEPTG